MSHLLASASPAYTHPLFKAVLVLHILAAMVWLGGGVTLGALGAIGWARREPADRVSDLERATKVRTYCFVPAAFVLLGCGLGLVALGHVSLGAPWVDLALGGWAITVALSVGYLIPTGDDLGYRAPLLGPDSPELRALVLRLRLLGALEALILVLVLIDMVARP